MSRTPYTRNYAVVGRRGEPLTELQFRFLRKLVERSGSVSCYELIDELWPGVPEPVALNRLRGTVHHLRRRIGDVFESGLGSYRLKYAVRLGVYGSPTEGGQ